MTRRAQLILSSCRVGAVEPGFQSAGIVAAVGEPFRHLVTAFGRRSGQCRACRTPPTGLLVGTVMERSHTPLSVWFWAAYLVASQTPGMSGVQFQRQLGLTRYETVLRESCTNCALVWCWPDQDRIGGTAGRACSKSTKRGSADGRAARAEASTTRRWLPLLLDQRSATARPAPHKTSARTVAQCRSRSPCHRHRSAAPMPWAGSSRAPSCRARCIVTDDWSRLMVASRARGYDHHAIAECGDPAGGRGVHADHPSRLQQSENLAQRSSTTA